MTFQEDPKVIRWRLHLRAAPEEVFDLLTTDSGRARFWAETAVEREGRIHFTFPNGWEWQGEILEHNRPTLFALNYFDSETRFVLEDDGAGGTILTLTDRGVLPEYRTQVIAGWVSVLMALKAAVDFGVDLRNHDPRRTWDQGFCDN